VGPVFDVLPVTREGTVLVPAAPLAQWLGVLFEQRGTEAVAGVDLARPRLVLRAGSVDALLEGKPHRLSLAPEIIHGEFFVPLRSFAEHFGAWVNSEGRLVRLAVPQRRLAAELMAAPDPADHLGKIWKVVARWLGLRDAGKDNDPWQLLSARRRQKILAEVGPEAPRLVRERFDSKSVKGMRIVADGLNLQDGTGWVLATVLRQDGAVLATRFEMMLERTGWRVDRITEQTIMSKSDGPRDEDAILTLELESTQVEEELDAQSLGCGTIVASSGPRSV